MIDDPFAFMRYERDWWRGKCASVNTRLHMVWTQTGRQSLLIFTFSNIWLSTLSQRRILDLWNKVYLDFGKFTILKNTLKYESYFVFAFYVDEQHLDMYTYKVETQHRRRWLDTAIHNRYKDRKYLLGYLLMFQFRI